MQRGAMTSRILGHDNTLRHPIAIELKQKVVCGAGVRMYRITSESEL